MEIALVLLLFQAIVFGFFSSYIAGEKNRGKVGWFFLGFFFSLLALLTLIAIPKGDQPSIESLALPSDSRKCPFCAESVKIEAKICKHCQKDLPEFKAKTLQQKEAEQKPLAPEWDRTSLHAAALYGNWESVGRLLKTGIDVNQKNEKGETALDIALARGDQHIISMLLPPST